MSAFINYFIFFLLYNTFIVQFDLFFFFRKNNKNHKNI